ncbi:XAC2610-related protein [Fusobacterium sp. PH5-44]|uniref:XAC2610-related protein n=1 Tax=unclassified Fusobacterium TaxID=2648384 RepID=UPI003D216849
MKKYIILIIIIFSNIIMFGVNTKNNINYISVHNIDNFSDRYYAKVFLTEKIDNYREIGIIVIYDIKTNKELIRVDSDDVSIEFDDEGKVKINVHELPYGEQSLIIYEDFDFDGVKDFAIKDGNTSGYGGPSFQIYLDKKGKLIHHKGLTELAHEYLGMFYVNNKNKTLETMSKSGAAWHSYSTFKIINNKLIHTKLIEEDARYYPFFLIEETKISNGKETIKKRIIIDDINEIMKEYPKEMNKILDFQIIENKKRVVVYMDSLDNLHYVLLKDKNVVEFLYPALEDIKNNTLKERKFQLDKNKKILTFFNKSAKYIIYQEEDKEKITDIGVLVETNGKKYDLKGNVKTIEGTLDDLLNKNVENLQIIN